MNTDAYIDGKKDEIVTELCGLLRIDSTQKDSLPGAPFGQGVRDALDYTLSLCRKMGLNAVNVDGYAGYAEIPGAQGEQIGVLSHLDVVPAGGVWKYPPFSAKIADGYIYARGVCDDKAPAVCSIYALAALAQSGQPVKKNFRLIFGCNEESGWGCIDYYKKHIGLPDVGFSPDADYPIINTEKGIINVTFTKKTGTAMTAEGGERSNVVPPSAVAAVKCSAIPAEIDGVSYKNENGSLIITAKGVSAHGSTPEKGVNAILRLADAVSQLGTEDSEPASRIYAAFAPTDGAGIPGLKCRDEISGELSVNLGLLSVKDGEISFTIDIRYPVTASLDKIENALKEAFPDFDYYRGHWQPPHHTPEDHYMVAALKKVYTKYTGLEGKCLAIGGGTYARALKTGVAFGVTREGGEELAHNANERKKISEIIEDAKIFAAAYSEIMNA